MSALSIPLKKIDDALPLPAYAHPGDAGVDLMSTERFDIAPFERALVPCGIAVAIPEGYAGLVVPRSGLAIKHGISLVNSPGVIDSNYRGEIKAILMNLDPRNSFTVNRGDRIAQFVIVPFSTALFTTCDDLAQTGRGEAGFGSSGVTSFS